MSILGYALYQDELAERRERAQKPALQAMHDLLVWMLCMGCRSFHGRAGLLKLVHFEGFDYTSEDDWWPP
jgi:hypothetical protein